MDSETIGEIIILLNNILSFILVLFGVKYVAVA